MTLPASLSPEARKLLSLFTPSEQSKLCAFYTEADEFIGLGVEEEGTMAFYIREPKYSAILRLEELYRKELESMPKEKVK